jgi:hypothetical protein
MRTHFILLQSAIAMSLNTTFLLMAQYDGKAIIPLDEVRRDFFSHLTLAKFLRKLSSGDIALPLMPIETSQKCAKGVHLQDLADYLDSVDRRPKGV